MARQPGENPIVQELQSNIIQDNVLTEDEKKAFEGAYSKDKYAVFIASRNRQGKLRDFILKDVRTHVEQSIGGEKVKLVQSFFNAKNAKANTEGGKKDSAIAEDAIFGPDVMRQIVNYQIEKNLPVNGILDAQLLAQIEADFSQLKGSPKGTKRPIEVVNPKKIVQPVVETRVNIGTINLEKHTLANLRSALQLPHSDAPFDATLQREVALFQQKYNRGDFGFLAIFGNPTPPDTLLNAKGIPDKATLDIIFAFEQAKNMRIG